MREALGLGAEADEDDEGGGFDAVRWALVSTAIASASSSNPPPPPSTPP